MTWIVQSFNHGLTKKNNLNHLKRLQKTLDPPSSFFSPSLRRKRCSFSWCLAADAFKWKTLPQPG